MPRGVFRDDSFAHVAYDDNVTVPISKSLYALRGYQPPFDELPARNQPVRGTFSPATHPRQSMAKLELRS